MYVRVCSCVCEREYIERGEVCVCVCVCVCIYRYVCVDVSERMWAGV